MSIVPQDLVDVAKRLAAGSAEVDHRASVSRAYYAAYQFALEWESRLPCKGSEDGARGTHIKLINRLRYPGPLCTKQQQIASKKLAVQLDRLKAHRVFADYTVEGTMRLAVATQVLADTEILLLSA